MSSFLRDVTMRLNVSRKSSTSSMDEKERNVGTRRPLALRPPNLPIAELSRLPRVSHSDADVIHHKPTYVGDSLIGVQDAAHIDLYLKNLEKRRALHADFLCNCKVSGRMRTTLVDWMINVTNRLELKSETWLLSVSILDRVTLKIGATRHNYQLIGLACLFVAAKYEEIILPSVDDFIFMAGDLITKKDLYEMEKEVFKHVGFNLSFSFYLHHLRKFRSVMSKKHVMAVYELALCCCDVIVIDYNSAHWLPLTIASVSMYVAFEAALIPFDKKLLEYMCHTETQLAIYARRVAPSLVELCSSRSQLKGLRRQHFKNLEPLATVGKRLNKSK